MIRADLVYSGAGAKALGELAASLPRLNRQLADELQQAVWEANRIERLLGRDASGAPLRPVRQPRVGRYAGSSGPPMAPDGDASGAIAGFVVRVAQQGGEGFTLTAGHRGRIARILAWHGTGRSGTGIPISRGGQIVGFRGLRGRVSGIVRDVRGIGPQGRDAIRKQFARHPGRIAQAFRAAARRAATFFGSL